MGSKGSLKGIKALVVDDAQVVQAALQLILSELDCEVTVAGSGQQAIDLFDFSFDVIFMDFVMPGMNGDEAVKAIRQKEKNQNKKNSTYIIGLTANNSEEVNRACMDAGINTVIEKPINPEALRKLLSELDLKN